MKLTLIKPVVIGVITVITTVPLLGYFINRHIDTRVELATRAYSLKMNKEHAEELLRIKTVNESLLIEKRALEKKLETRVTEIKTNVDRDVTIVLSGDLNNEETIDAISDIIINGMWDIYETRTYISEQHIDSKSTRIPTN